MRFDSNQAWKDASQAVSANRDILLVLAGVFFLLPSLAFALFFPQPQPQPGATPEQAFALAGEFYSNALPYLMAMGIVQAIGTLAILTLFTDRSRPTVGEAIRLGVAGLLPYFGAQLLLGVAVGLIGGLPLGLAVISRSPLLIAAVAVAVVFGVAYVALRTVLTAPVVAVEHVRSPVEALRRSWNLTRGNAGRIFVFFLLLGLAFGVAVVVVMMVVGVLLALFAGAETARTLSAVVSSFLTSVLTLYFIAALAAIHRQLSGPSPESVRATFE